MPRHAPLLTGQSLLPLLTSEPSSGGWNTTFASHQSHEISTYYPMRAVRTRQHKLILNLNYKMPFPIDMDFAASATFTDLLNRTKSHQSLHWFSSLDKYYYRPPFELYDLMNDPKERVNLYNQTAYAPVAKQLLMTLRAWQRQTNDPWICSPFAVPGYDGTCKPLLNSIPVPEALNYEL